MGGRTEGPIFTIQTLVFASRNQVILEYPVNYPPADKVVLFSLSKKSSVNTTTPNVAAPNKKTP